MRTGPLIFSLLLAFCNAENTPTVLWHAMGDSCCNPITMGYFIDTIKSVIFLLYLSNFKFLKIQSLQETDAYVLSLQIGDNAIDDTLNGFFLDTNVQIEMVCKQIAEDPELQNGYNAIGLSQVSKNRARVIRKIIKLHICLPNFNPRPSKLKSC